MTEKEKHIAKKKKEIEKISKQQVRLMAKTLAIAMRIRALEMQKQLIIAQPIPNSLPGRSAIVGLSGPEQIITPNGTITIPANQHPRPYQQPPPTIRPVPGIDKGSDV